MAAAIELSISAVSRLERGIRGLRVEQLVAWAGSLGYRIDIVLWKPVLPEEQWKPGAEAPALDPESLALLAEVAAVLPHLPLAARRALAAEMKVWREETEKGAGG